MIGREIDGQDFWFPLVDRLAEHHGCHDFPFGRCAPQTETWSRRIDVNHFIARHRTGCREKACTKIAKTIKIKRVKNINI